jgi:hypothetical protein
MPVAAFPHLTIRRAPQVARIVTDLSQGISNADFVRLHTFIYKLATIPPVSAQEPETERMYRSLAALVEEVCAGITAELLLAPSEVLLEAYTARWRTFSMGMQVVNALFDYMNRYWIRDHCASGSSPTPGVHSNVLVLGVALWRERVQTPQIAQRMFDAIWVHLVDVRGGGALMQAGVFREVLSIYVELGDREVSRHGTATAPVSVWGTPADAAAERVYEMDFATPFLKYTLHVYSEEAAELAAAQDCAAFVLRAHDRISSELAAASRFILPETVPALRKICERAFVEEQLPWLQQLFRALLDDGAQRPLLARLFGLLGRVEGGLEDGKRRFRDLVVKEGTSAVAAQARDAPHGEHAEVAPSDFIALIISRCSLLALLPPPRGLGFDEWNVRNELRRGLMRKGGMWHSYERYISLVRECLGSDPAFIQALHDGLGTMVHLLLRGDVRVRHRRCCP